MTPDLTAISLGAGVQSTVLALLAAEGTLPKPDAAIFADTGWEPRRVYAHLSRLRRLVLTPAGIPLLIVRQGNLRNDALDPDHRYASVPYFVQNEPGPCGRCEGSGQTQLADTDLPDTPANRLPDPRPCPRCRGTGWDDGKGMGPRQCTSEYKLAPIRRKIRELLGAAPPDFRRVPKGRVCEEWVGFSTDEIGRVSDDSRLYLSTRHPLLELDWSRSDCQRYLRSRGWTKVGKSACIGCPYHGNRQWRDLRDNDPAGWADAVAFDAAIRKGGSRGLPLNGEAFLHRSRVPLDQAPIDRVTSAEWKDRQVDIYDAIADEIAENGEPDGCSPYGCRSGAAVD